MADEEKTMTISGLIAVLLKAQTLYGDIPVWVSTSPNKASIIPGHDIRLPPENKAPVHRDSIRFENRPKCLLIWA